MLRGHDVVSINPPAVLGPWLHASAREATVVASVAVSKDIFIELRDHVTRADNNQFSES